MIEIIGFFAVLKLRETLRPADPTSRYPTAVEGRGGMAGRKAHNDTSYHPGFSGGPRQTIPILCGVAPLFWEGKLVSGFADVLHTVFEIYKAGHLYQQMEDYALLEATISVVKNAHNIIHSDPNSLNFDPDKTLELLQNLQSGQGSQSRYERTREWLEWERGNGDCPPPLGRQPYTVFAPNGKQAERFIRMEFRIRQGIQTGPGWKPSDEPFWASIYPHRATTKNKERSSKTTIVPRQAAISPPPVPQPPPAPSIISHDPPPIPYIPGMAASSVYPPPVKRRIVGAGELVELPSSITAADVLESAAKLQDDAHSLDEWTRSRMAGTGGLTLGLQFDEVREKGEKAIIVSRLDPARDYWILGDIHGDLLALEAAIDVVRSVSGTTPWTMICMGDYVDDGRHGAEVFLKLLDLARADPKSLCLLAGNHDEAITCTHNQFYSTVDQLGFAAWLNSDPQQAGHREKIGRLFCDVVATLPRAIFLPHGTILTHGGIAHTDLHEKIQTVSDLSSSLAIRDYAWTRIHARAKRKVPDRSSSGCEFGHQDFVDFCNVLERILERPFSRLIRGHDHESERYSKLSVIPPHTIHTLNLMSHRLDRERSGPYARHPHIALLRESGEPQIYKVQISEQEVGRIHNPLPVTAGPSTS
ncbi:hypothetical protein BH09SUM1_BH09SUM1_09680 [soil metagenome]